MRQSRTSGSVGTTHASWGGQSPRATQPFLPSHNLLPRHVKVLERTIYRSPERHTIVTRFNTAKEAVTAAGLHRRAVSATTIAIRIVTVITDLGTADKTIVPDRGITKMVQHGWLDSEPLSLGSAFPRQRIRVADSQSITIPVFRIKRRGLYALLKERMAEFA